MWSSRTIKWNDHVLILGFYLFDWMLVLFSFPGILLVASNKVDVKFLTIIDNLKLVKNIYWIFRVKGHQIESKRRQSQRVLDLEKLLTYLN